MKVCVVGSTGAVGRKMAEVLLERRFPLRELSLFASERSAGKKLAFGDKEITVQKLEEDSGKGIDIALFSAGATVSQKFAPYFAKDGAVVIDNSSAFRMDTDVPLVVPEVNPEDIKWHKGIIANPNCSTIQMVVVLSALHRAKKIKRVVVSTYQSVSGTGQKAINELKTQLTAIIEGKKPEAKVYPYQIAANLLPHIDIFLPNRYTKEEMKMVNETRKIMHADFGITVTTVRVPVFVSHSESVNVEFYEPFHEDEARRILESAEGVVVCDDPDQFNYPYPLMAEGRDEVFVGRIRQDFSMPDNCALNIFIVADNLRKGAATNAVQIAEKVYTQ
ncbi:aspartate-semialdehyde dehydrogenase [bacterium]|nr:aspartate-semialdehyde dehydrogenase [bacterium]